MPSSASGRRRTAAPARSARRRSAGAAGAQSLAEFLSTAGTLTIEDRKLIVDQALLLLEENYAHLPLKMAMHAVNPVQRLRVLRTRLDHQVDSPLDPDASKHDYGIVTSLGWTF